MPKSELKIALLPLDIVQGNIKENLNNVARALSMLPTGTDLIIFPELFTTGFLRSHDFIAQSSDTINGITMENVTKWARQYEAAVSGSFLCRTDEGIVNRGFITLPDGNSTFYDKHHLFSMGGEGEFISPGTNQASLVDYKGWKLKLIICYDLRFPAWCRTNADNPYDLLIVPANWADSRSYAWKHLLIARAIENQAFVAGCNRSGIDKYGAYSVDNTLILDNWGKPVGTYDLRIPLVTATLDANNLNDARTRFAVLRDVDSINLNGI